MKKHAIRQAVLSSLFCVLLHPSVRAQASTSMGTEFWLTFMENLDLGFNGSPYLYIVVSSPVNTQGELQVPSTGDAFPFTVVANVATVVFVPSNYSYPIGAEVYYADGLKIVADDPIDVYAVHHRLYFSDATLVLPVERLASEYMVVAHLDFNGASPSQLAIEATHDSSVVEITPSVQTISFHAAHVPYTITLDEGEVYQLQSFDDLSGTIVRSLDASKPLAVFAGSKMGTVSCNAATDHEWTQVMPFRDWGTGYAVVPYKDRGGDLFKLIALHDNTVISISGGTTLTLDSAEFVDQFIANPAVLSSQLPFAVVQFNQSQSCNVAVGDGCMAWVPPSSCTRSASSWHNLTGPGGPPGGWTNLHTLNVWTKVQTGMGVFLLDGVDISSSFSPMTSSPTYWYARLDIAEGAHALTGTLPFQAQTSGFGDYNSWSHFTGWTGEDIGTGILPWNTQQSTSGCTVVNDQWLLSDAQCGSGSEVRVLDAVGRIVLSSSLPRGGAVIDVTGLVPGQYCYQLMDGTSGVKEFGRLLIVR